MPRFHNTVLKDGNLVKTDTEEKEGFFRLPLSKKKLYISQGPLGVQKEKEEGLENEDFFGITFSFWIFGWSDCLVLRQSWFRFQWSVENKKEIPNQNWKAFWIFDSLLESCRTHKRLEAKKATLLDPIFHSAPSLKGAKNRSQGMKPCLDGGAGRSSLQSPLRQKS